MGCNDVAERRAEIALREHKLEETLTILMKAYGQEILQFCFSMLKTKEDAQDVLQVVFIQAHACFASFAGNSSFRTWLWSIARHRCLDHLKSARRLQSHLEFVDDLPDILTDDNDHSQEDASLSKVLHSCLEKLPEKVRTAVILRLQLDHSYEEIAEMVLERAGTLQARVARALPVLRRCVELQGVRL